MVSEHKPQNFMTKIVAVSSRQLLSFLWGFFARSPWTFGALLLVSFTWSFDATLWPYTLRMTVDTLTAYESHRENIFVALRVPIIYGIALWLLIEFGFRLQGFLLARFFPKLEANIRLTLFDHVQRHSPKYFNQHLAGSLTNKITDMTTHTTQAMWQFLYSIIPAFGTFLVSLYFYSQVNTIFTITLCLIMTVYVVVCWVFATRCTRKEQEHAESRSSLLGKILDSLTNNFSVNLLFRFHLEKKYIMQFQKEEKEKHIVAKKYVEFMRTCLSITFLSGGMIINGYMLYLWQQHRMSTGEIVQIFNMTWNIVLILWYAGVEIPSLFQSIGILKQAVAIFHDPQDVTEAAQVPALKVTKGEIFFDQVCFDYDEKKLFHNKSVLIRGGEKIGLVGCSGAGKSTFVNLILRFFSPQKGRILIDGQDITQVSLESLREHIAFIPQSPLLFHRSIEENIAYGRVDATSEELIETAKLAHCHEFIQTCPHSYQTIVGERGSKLSGGERQRIVIARAMLSNAPIIILDEATSSLDSITEKHIQESLQKLMSHKTTIIIAHRLSTLVQMDRILVFHEGRIIEEGSHEELLALGGHYVKMWEMQNGSAVQEACYAHAVLH
jgi:ATP-binding cassette, subfamily B, bacterial